MLKRTIGRYLLTILVVTGLAGTITNNSLTKPERKKALNLMKDTKAELLRSVKDLNTAQLNFRMKPGTWSVRDCMYHIAISEKKLWKMMETAMKSRSSSAKRREVKLSDEEIIEMMVDRTNDLNTFDAFDPRKTPYKKLNDAVVDFKDSRAEHIKYLRTSTEDLRNHVVQLSFGTIDCYQLCLLIASHCNRHNQQIEEIKAAAGFPK
jgi:hypothetical protein